MTRALIRELLRPSSLPPGPQHRAYDRAVVGIAHGLLGAAMVGTLFGLAAPVMVLIRASAGIAYWMAKETGDLRRGGDLWDGIEDAAMVGLGAWWWGASWWPDAMLGLGFVLMLSGAARAS